MMPTIAPDAPSPLERIIRRDRLTTVIGLAAITVLAWIYLVREAAGMQSMAMDSRMHAAMGMADMHVWGAADWLALFVMWTVMMAGMMLPSAAPVILLVLAAYRRRGERRARAASAAFIGGYLFAWTMFSGIAAAIQVGLHRTALLTPEMASGSAKLAGTILLVAGVYQWLPIKNMCLTHCQSPLGFVTRYWREGPVGGFRMGVRHGTFCVGCCWSLMTLLFVVGVMNLIWVAAIAGFVLVEKLAPQGPRLARVAGVLLIVWGGYVLVPPAFG